VSFGQLVGCTPRREKEKAAKISLNGPEVMVEEGVRPKAITEKLKYSAHFFSSIILLASLPSMQYISKTSSIYFK
jgi:hypothetical protein